MPVFIHVAYLEQAIKGILVVLLAGFCLPGHCVKIVAGLEIAVEHNYKGEGKKDCQMKRERLVAEFGEHRMYGFEVGGWFKDIIAYIVRKVNI